MTKCKSCGSDISAKGKVTCPNCGGVNRKPIYKRGWFVVLAIFILIGALGSLGSEDGDSNTTAPLATKSEDIENSSVAEKKTKRKKKRKRLQIKKKIRKK